MTYHLCHQGNPICNKPISNKVTFWVLAGRLKHVFWRSQISNTTIPKIQVTAKDIQDLSLAQKTKTIRKYLSKMSCHQFYTLLDLGEKLAHITAGHLRKMKVCIGA